MKQKYIETFDGKQMPIKDIQKVLRTQDSTKIYKLYKSIYGRPATCINMYYFIEMYGPTKWVRGAAMEIAFHSKPKKPKNCYDIDKFFNKMNQNKHKFYKTHPIQYVMQIFRNEIARGLDNYSKFPIMGDGILYFAHPIYKLNDYNKFAVIPIAGNERFCETLCRYVAKYLKTYNSI